MKGYKRMKAINEVVHKIGYVTFIACVLIGIIGAIVYNGTSKEKAVIVITAFGILGGYAVIALVIDMITHIFKVSEWNQLRKSNGMPWSWDYPD